MCVIFIMVSVTVTLMMRSTVKWPCRGPDADGARPGPDKEQIKLLNRCPCYCCRAFGIRLCLSLCRLFGQMDFIPEVDLNHVGSEVVMDLETLVSSRC